MTFQDWCVNTLEYILKNRNDFAITTKDKGFRYTVDAIVKHYAGMYHCSDLAVSKKGRTCVNLWWDEMASNRRELMLKSVVLSKRAREVACQKPLLSADELKGKLHWEHIVPCAKVLEELCALEDVNIENVRQCFRHNRLILISKDESRILDGKGTRFDEKDIERVRQSWPNELAAAVACKDERPLKGGTALLRIAKLQNNCVEFCKYENAQVLSDDELLSYLNSTCRELGCLS